MQRTQPTRRPPTISTPTPAAHDTTLVDEMDALLQDIDTILEDQDTLTNYIQRSGQ